MSTAMLMRRLMEIDTACSPQRKEEERQAREMNLDKFTVEKRDVARFIREIREDIQERNNLSDSPDKRSEVVTKSAEIRKKIREATEHATKLEKVHKEKHKKLKLMMKVPGGLQPSAEKKAKDENRKQVIDLMWQHLKELERQEKNVRNDNIASDDYEEGEQEVPGLGIAEIDDPRFEVLRKNDQEIDAALDDTLKGVIRLKKLALEMGEEVGQSNELIKEVQQMTEVTMGKLETVNGQLAKTLEAAQSPSSFCCDIILCCLLLGIATAIYFVATSH